MGRFWIIPVGFILLAAVLVWVWGTEANQPKPCVPFAQKQVPDENDGNWVETSGKIMMHNSGMVLSSRKYYEHKKMVGLNMGAYHYFNQLAFKAWACNESGRPVASKHPEDKKDHMVAVLKNGNWYIAHSQRPNITETATEVEIKLYDQNGNLVVERTINRPN